MPYPTSENASPHVCGSRREMTRRRPDSGPGFRKWQSSTALRSIKNHPCTLTFVSWAYRGKVLPLRGFGDSAAFRVKAPFRPPYRSGLPVLREHQGACPQSGLGGVGTLKAGGGEKRKKIFKVQIGTTGAPEGGRACDGPYSPEPGCQDPTTRVSVRSRALVDRSRIFKNFF